MLAKNSPKTTRKRVYGSITALECSNGVIKKGIMIKR
jgi:hypothetical protein